MQYLSFSIDEDRAQQINYSVYRSSVLRSTVLSKEDNQDAVSKDNNYLSFTVYNNDPFTSISPKIHSKFHSTLMNDLERDNSFVWDFCFDVSKVDKSSATRVLMPFPGIYSSIREELTSGNVLVETVSQINSSVIEDEVAGDGGGDGVGSELNITLEVFRHCEYKFKFPKRYLDGLYPNKIAKVVGDNLIVYTTNIGEVILYTDRGKITIRTLPGMKVRQGNPVELSEEI